MISNYFVSITKHGDGSITYQRDKVNCKVFISKNNKVIKDIFDYYYNQLDSFKHRHYALAKFIARDIREKGYIFKAYSNNPNNVRPILAPETLSIKHKHISEDAIFERQVNREVYELERLIH